jgi:hypothetical protein
MGPPTTLALVLAASAQWLCVEATSVPVPAAWKYHGGTTSGQDLDTLVEERVANDSAHKYRRQASTNRFRCGWGAGNPGDSWNIVSCASSGSACAQLAASLQTAVGDGARFGCDRYYQYVIQALDDRSAQLLQTAVGSGTQFLRMNGVAGNTASGWNNDRSYLCVPFENCTFDIVLLNNFLDQPSRSPTATPTATPTFAPTASPTPNPTATPTTTPGATPTPPLPNCPRYRVVSGRGGTQGLDYVNITGSSLYAVTCCSNTSISGFSAPTSK